MQNYRKEEQIYSRTHTKKKRKKKEGEIVELFLTREHTNIVIIVNVFSGTLCGVVESRVTVIIFIIEFHFILYFIFFLSGRD